MSLAAPLGLFYGLSEAAISILKRDRSGQSAAQDRGSLALIWIVVLAAVTAGIFVANRVAFGRYALSPPVLALALPLYFGGLALRWWAIAFLGPPPDFVARSAATDMMLSSICATAGEARRW